MIQAFKVGSLKSCVPETPNYDFTKTSQKHCYVCCTWDKKNLPVVRATADPNIIEKSKELFGENIICDGNKCF